MSDAPVGDATRPEFAASFPRDPALDALVAAFEAGDFRRVRDGAPKLAASATDASVQRAARELLARTQPDPLARWVLVITLALLVALSAWWIAHDGPQAGRAPPAPPPVIEKVH